MKFNYQARDQKGQTQVGVIEASSKEAALRLLGKNNLYVTILEEPKQQPFYAKKLAFFDRVSPKEVMLFARQLAIMFKSQVPLLESLRTLALQSGQNFGEKILQMSEDVEGGTPFSQAVAKFPDVFSAYFVSMVKSGESSGSLSKVLESLAQHEEREYELFSKLKSALTYPVFVIVISLAVLVLMMVVVVPNLTKMLEGATKLPLPTVIVLGISSVLRHWWPIVLVACAGSVIGAGKYLRTKQGRQFFDRYILEVPGVGAFLRMVYLSRFAENLSTLVAGAIPIVQALEITQDILGNHVYWLILEEAKESVKRGNPMSQTLQKYPKEFPPIFTQMMYVGEKSGTLDNAMLHIVQFYEKEVSYSVERFLNILEPMMIVALGVLIGGMMAAILLPMYQTISG